jgi:hypothetical protein
MNRQLLLGTEELVAVSASNPFRIVTGAIRVEARSRLVLKISSNEPLCSVLLSVEEHALVFPRVFVRGEVNVWVVDELLEAVIAGQHPCTRVLWMTPHNVVPPVVGWAGTAVNSLDEPCFALLRTSRILHRFVSRWVFALALMLSQREHARQTAAAELARNPIGALLLISVHVR